MITIANQLSCRPMAPPPCVCVRIDGLDSSAHADCSECLFFYFVFVLGVRPGRRMGRNELHWTKWIVCARTDKKCRPINSALDLLDFVVRRLLFREKQHTHTQCTVCNNNRTWWTGPRIVYTPKGEKCQSAHWMLSEFCFVDAWALTARIHLHAHERSFPMAEETDLKAQLIYMRRYGVDFETIAGLVDGGATWTSKRKTKKTTFQIADTWFWSIVCEWSAVAVFQRCFAVNTLIHSRGALTVYSELVIDLPIGKMRNVQPIIVIIVVAISLGHPTESNAPRI